MTYMKNMVVDQINKTTPNMNIQTQVTQKYFSSITNASKNFNNVKPLVLEWSLYHNV